MRRGLIYVICGLWMVVLAQTFLRYNRPEGQEDLVVQAFTQVEFLDTEVYVELSGNYDAYLEAADRDRLLTGIGERLGVTEGFLITTENKSNGSETVYTKITPDAEIVLKYLSVQEGAVPDNYLVIQMTLQENLDFALSYKNLIEEIGKEYGSDGTVCLQMKGTYPRKLDLEEKNRETDLLMAQLEAEELSSAREGDFYTVYGYSPFVEDYVYTGSYKINVNIAFHDIGNTTECYLGVPVIRTDY